MFYKLLEDGFLSFGPYVQSADYLLIDEFHLDYTYPVHGWVWMDTYAEALEYFGLPPE